MNELNAFNIKVKQVNAQTFFGNAILPRVTVSPVILNNLEAPAGPLRKADIDFFGYMNGAMPIRPNKQAFVVEFTAFVFKMMGYDEGCRLIYLWEKMGFEMCGKHVYAEADICIEEYSGAGSKYLLLMKEDKVCKPFHCVLRIHLPLTC